MTNDTPWPRKTRELQNHHLDSTVWNDFSFRPDDVIVASYAKAGTTWVQQLVGQLVFGGAADIQLHEISPWLDLRVMPPDTKEKLAAQTHRRIIKTHLPLDALNFSPLAKYIYVARDGRDVAWSLHHHHLQANQLWYDLVNETPGRVGPTVGRPDPDIHRYFLHWLEYDGAPIWSFWDSVSSWWAARHLPNVMLVHYADLKSDLPGQAGRIAEYLGIEVAERDWSAILEHSSFDHMKRHANLAAPMGGAIFEDGAEAFFHRGSNGRWRNTLTADDIAKYETAAVERLGRECAGWLAGGSLNRATQ